MYHVIVMLFFALKVTLVATGVVFDACLQENNLCKFMRSHEHVIPPLPLKGAPTITRVG